MRNILFIPLLVLLVSCTRDVPLDLPRVPPRLVLNAPVTSDADVTAFLSKSWFILDTVTNDGVTGGTIQVYINDRLKGTMQPAADTKFAGQYVLPGCRAGGGDRLKLVASAPGFDPVEGETVMPGRPEVLSVDTARYIAPEHYWGMMPHLRLYIRFQDEAGKRNYYRLIVEKQTEYIKGDSVIVSSSMYQTDMYIVEQFNLKYEDPVFRLTTTNPTIEQLDGYTCRGTFPDDTFDGEEYTVRSSFYPVYDSYKGDSVTTVVHYDVRLMTVSSDYYQYLTVVRNLSISLGDAYLDGLLEPAATYTNVKGGFGIVAGSQLYHRRFTMPFGDVEPWTPFDNPSYYPY